MVVTAAAIGDAGFPFVEFDLVFAECERRHADAVLRFRPAIKFLSRRAHGELPRGDVHHLRTLRAVLERCAACCEARAGGNSDGQNGQHETSQNEGDANAYHAMWPYGWIS